VCVPTSFRRALCAAVMTGKLSPLRMGATFLSDSRKVSELLTGPRATSLGAVECHFPCNLLRFCYRLVTVQGEQTVQNI
jgi:hypothetical protein